MRCFLGYPRRVDLAGMLCVFHGRIDNERMPATDLSDRVLSFQTWIHLLGRHYTRTSWPSRRIFLGGPMVKAFPDAERDTPIVTPDLLLSQKKTERFARISSWPNKANAQYVGNAAVVERLQNTDGDFQRSGGPCCTSLRTLRLISDYSTRERIPSDYRTAKKGGPASRSW